MSGLETEITNESWNAIFIGLFFFGLGSFSRILVQKIDQALVLSASIGSLITIFVLIFDAQNHKIQGLLDYLVLLAYSSVVAQIGNTITGLTIRFLTWVKDEFL